MTGYLADRSHLLLSGVTGARTEYGGKTALANWWSDTWGRSAFDVVLFFNTKQDQAPRQTADQDVPDVDRAADAIEAGATYVSITPATPDWAEMHTELLRLVRWLPEDWQIAVVHDEAPEYDGDSLLTFVRVLGNGANCKSVVIAQSPGDLSKSVRKQCILVWVGPTTGDEKAVFEANKRGRHFSFIDENHDPYEWSVLLGPAESDRDTFPPVPEEYADA